MVAKGMRGAEAANKIRPRMKPVETMGKRKKKKAQIHRSTDDGSDAGQPVRTKQISRWNKARQITAAFTISQPLFLSPLVRHILFPVEVRWKSI